MIGELLLVAFAEAVLYPQGLQKAPDLKEFKEALESLEMIRL